MFEMPAIKKRDDGKPNLLKMLIQNVYVYYGLAVLIIIATLGLHTYPNYNELNNTKTLITNSESEIAALEKQIREKEIELEGTKQEFGLYSEKYSPRINKVLPVGEQLGPLTRFLESFALQLEKSGVMTLSAISYGGLKSIGEASTLPIRLSFQANNVNFVRFMQMIANSGSIEEKDFYDGDPIRMMQVDQISVTIPNFETEGAVVVDEDPLYTINLQVSAFNRN